MSFYWRASERWGLPQPGGHPEPLKKMSCYPHGYEVAFLGLVLALNSGILLQSRHIEEADAWYALLNHWIQSILELCLVVETRIVMHVHHPCPFPFRATRCERDVSVEEFERKHRLYHPTAGEELEVQVELLPEPECW